MPEVLKIDDMKEVVTASGKTHTFLGFDLRDLVALIPSEGATLHWVAISMNGETWMTGENLDETFARRVEESETGVELTWPEVLQLSTDIYQTIWGTFIGVRDPADRSRVASLFENDWHYVFRAKEEFFEVAEIAIQAVDSSFWVFYAKDPAVTARIKSAFKSVSVMT